MGFAMPIRLPESRCALTTPFHPYRKTPGGLRRPALDRRYLFCCTFPDRRYMTAQSADVIRHRVRWSPDFPLLPKKQRPPVPLPGIITNLKQYTIHNSPHNRPPSFPDRPVSRDRFLPEPFFRCGDHRGREHEPSECPHAEIQVHKRPAPLKSDRCRD